MFTLVLGLVARAYFVLRTLMPTNRLTDAIRTRRGLKWGIPAMLLGVPYVLAAAVCTNLIEAGGPSWLHLLVMVFLWDALKFVVIGPTSVLLLLVALVREAQGRRRATQPWGVADSAAEPLDQPTMMSPRS